MTVETVDEKYHSHC